MSAESTDRLKPSSQEQKRQFWNGHIRDQERSGHAQRDYCQCHGLSFANFTRWRGLTLKARAAGKSPATSRNTNNQFVPVQVVPATPLSAAAYDHSVDLVLCDGTRIERITGDNVSVATALIAQL